MDFLGVNSVFLSEPDSCKGKLSSWDKHLRMLSEGYFYKERVVLLKARVEATPIEWLTISI